MCVCAYVCVCVPTDGDLPTKLDYLTSIFNAVWTNESVPSDWTKQLIVPIHKKGSQSECDNFRGIALPSVPSSVHKGYLQSFEALS